MTAAILTTKALLAVMLLVAGAAKLADLASFAATIRLLAPRRPFASAPAQLTATAPVGEDGAGPQHEQLEPELGPAPASSGPADAGPAQDGLRRTQPESSAFARFRAAAGPVLMLPWSVSRELAGRMLGSAAGARRLAAGVAAGELALGGASLALPRVHWLDIAVLAACCGFAGVAGAGLAFRRGRSCRCFGALAQRRFDRAGLARAVAVAGLAGLATAAVPEPAVLLVPAATAALAAGAALLSFVAFTAARSLAVSRDALPGMVP